MQRIPIITADLRINGKRLMFLNFRTELSTAITGATEELALLITGYLSQLFFVRTGISMSFVKPCIMNWGMLLQTSINNMHITWLKLSKKGSKLRRLTWHRPEIFTAGFLKM